MLLMEIIETIIMIVSFLAIYFLPTLISSKGPKQNMIILINIFLGFTYVGWVVALIMVVYERDKLKYEEEVDEE